MANFSIPLKKCSRKDKCSNPAGCWQPATSEYFHKSKHTKDGFTNQCKQCVRARNQQPAQKEAARIRNARPEVRARMYEYRQSPRGQQVLKKYNDSNKAKTRMREFYARPEQREKRRRYSSLVVVKTRRQIYEQLPEIRLKIRAYQRSERGKHVFKLASQRRRARKLTLPDTLTMEEWVFALEYFHGCCAACGRQLMDLFGSHTVAMDHWIPLTSPDCPGTIASNIIPLCHGLNGCNNSKYNRDAFEWLVWKFGTNEAQRIMTKINGYVNHLKLRCVK